MRCKPCEGGVPPMANEEAMKYIKEVPDWVLEDSTIKRNFKFKNFKAALDFVNRVGEIAEGEGHHPDILLYSWNRVRLTLSTHAIKGLSENDFIIAAKVDRLVELRLPGLKR